jgi:hypothetical protein
MYFRTLPIALLRVEQPNLARYCEVSHHILGRQRGVHMANQEHVAQIKRGAKVWNEWRKENPAIVPDLSKADLSKADLRNADLTGADLAGANLGDADLTSAYLGYADLTSANLGYADLGSANLGDANLTGADLTGADLGNVNLTGANLGDAALYQSVDKLLRPLQTYPI